MTGRPDALTVVQLLLAKYHAEALAPALARIAQLEAQLAQLQRRLERGHRGTYQPGALYETGDEVTRNGSTWRAKVDDPKEGPPGDGRSWQLVSQGYRRGANGKALHENA